MDERRERVKAIARECVEASLGNWEEAHALYKAKLNDDPVLFGEVMQPLVDQAVWALIRGVARDTRKQIVSPLPPREDDKADLMAIAGRFLSYPLSGGLMLGNARRPDLLAEIGFREKIARANAINARWLAVVERALPDDEKQVRDVCSDEDLGKMLKKAEGVKR